MSFRSSWVGSARLITGAFGAVMNGLTSSMPTGADRNIDMLRRTAAAVVNITAANDDVVILGESGRDNKREK